MKSVQLVGMVVAALVVVPAGCSRSAATRPGSTSKAMARDDSREGPSVRAAREVLAKSRKAYAGLKGLSCRQTGHSSVSGIGDLRTQVILYFRRPDCFRLEVKEPPTLIVARGNHIDVSAPPDSIFPQGLRYSDTSLDNSLGFPAVTAWLLPALLGVSDHWPSVLAPDTARISGQEKLDGRDCYRIEGTMESEGKVTYWIDKHSFMLRRLVSVITNNGLMPQGIQQGYGKAWQAQGKQGREQWESTQKEYAKHKGEPSTQEDTFTDIQLNPALPDELFVLR